MVPLEVASNLEQGGNSVSDGRAQLLRRSSPYVAGGKDAADRSLKVIVGLDEAPFIEFDGSAEKRGVRRESNEYEGRRRMPPHLSARGAVARDDLLEPPP